MPEWRGWKECKRLVVIYREEHPNREIVEIFEGVLAALSDGILTIKKGANETYVRARFLEGWEIELREFACSKCRDGRLAPPKGCPTCGRMPTAEIESSGRIKIPLADGGMIILEKGEKLCEACGGRGYVHLGPHPDHRISCDTCDGRGKVRASIDIKTEDADRTCPGCGGDGWRLIAGSARKVDCGICGGSGKVVS